MVVFYCNNKTQDGLIMVSKLRTAWKKTLLPVTSTIVDIQFKLKRTDA